MRLYAAVRWIEELKTKHVSQQTTVSAAATLREDEIIRDKVKASLKSCTLDGFRVIHQVYISGLANEEELKNSFDVSAIENADSCAREFLVVLQRKGHGDDVPPVSFDDNFGSLDASRGPLGVWTAIADIHHTARATTRTLPHLGDRASLVAAPVGQSPRLANSRNGPRVSTFGKIETLYT
jgi:hypothetical protein